jgi:hypothetical protein
MANPERVQATKSELLTGTFRDRESAERAYNGLTDRGYTEKEVNVMMSDDTRKRHFTRDNEVIETDLGNKAAAGGVTGATIGGAAGAIVGVLAAAGTLALPGLGLVIAGPIAAGLAGLGAGGAAGGLIGGLIGAGIPEDRAKIYEKDIKDGGIVMGVKPRSDDDAKYFEKEWGTYRGENIYR